MTKDPSFLADRAGLEYALEALLKAVDTTRIPVLPGTLPQNGIGEHAVLSALAPIVLDRAQPLGEAQSFAHMDPPTPWITWATSLWNAALNQNLLHPDLSPAATEIEARVIDWLAPLYGMDGGHMVPGSTIANLTALWAAREVAGVTKVITSQAAHLSVAKAAHMLGLEFKALDTNHYGRINPSTLGDDLSKSALVLTAGTTSAGAIDDLGLCGRAAWTHVDAAWAGPLQLSPEYAPLLAGIENADSVSISAHKWFFQPKSSGLILFSDNKKAESVISFGGAYLSTANVGVLGSHGAVAVPLLATLLAWGQNGLAQRIERAMGLADDLWRRLEAHPGVELFGRQESGVILWRPKNAGDVDTVLADLPAGAASVTRLGGKRWLRHVAANPNADIEALWLPISRALE